jgi:predicted DNA-binding transcriptional regulator AlpA
VSETTVQPLALSATDLGRLLSISVRQVWTWDSTGLLGPAPLKLSERISRWDRSEIERWWAACRAAGRRIGRREWLAMREGGSP